MKENKNNLFKKTRFYFLIAAVLIGVPQFMGLYSGQTGHLLVATSKTENDPNFSKSVIYVFYNGIRGANGIIINFPLEHDEISEEFVDYSVFKGGPVAFPSYKSVIINSPSKASRWKTQPFTVMDYGVYKTYHDNKKEQLPPLYFGFAGWIPGQLEAELRRGVWRVLECDNLDFISGINSSDLWEYLNGDIKKTTCR